MAGSALTASTEANWLIPAFPTRSTLLRGASVDPCTAHHRGHRAPRARGGAASYGTSGSSKRGARAKHRQCEPGAGGSDLPVGDSGEPQPDIWLERFDQWLPGRSSISGLQRSNRRGAQLVSFNGWPATGHRRPDSKPGSATSSLDDARATLAQPLPIDRLGVLFGERCRCRGTQQSHLQRHRRTVDPRADRRCRGHKHRTRSPPMAPVPRTLHGRGREYLRDQCRAGHQRFRHSFERDRLGRVAARRFRAGRNDVSAVVDELCGNRHDQPLGCIGDGYRER